MGGKAAIIWTVVLALILAPSCGRKGRVATKVPPDPEPLYLEGLKLFNRGKYKKAEEVFTRVQNYFPGDRVFAPKAELRVADCYFMRKEYPEAIARYTEFKKHHPFHPDVPYAEYQIALAHFKQIRSKDRDQEETRRALAAFQGVLSNHPGTIFAEKAREKVDFCKRRLLEHELYISRFYMKKKKYPAVEKRLKAALLAYGGTDKDDELLYLLALSLLKQKKEAEAAAYLRHLSRNYPKSRYRRKAEERLARIKVKEVPEILITARGSAVAPEEIAFGRPKITALRHERIEEKETDFWSGDVKVEGWGITLRCDTLTAKERMGRMVEMTAWGDVKVKSGSKEIFCGRAFMDLEKKVLVMEENPRIIGGGTVRRAEKMILHLDSGLLEVIKEKPAEGM